MQTTESRGLFFRACGLPPVLSRVINGKVPLPQSGKTIDIPAWGYPPALIPLYFRPDSTFTGVWSHPLSPARPSTFVDYFASVEHASERARSFEQFAIMECSEDERRAEDVQFLRACGLTETDLPARYDVWRRDHPRFQGQAPASFYTLVPEPDYTGAFPVSNTVLTEETVRNICGHEVPEALLKRIRALSYCPPWFRTDDQPGTFELLLRDGDLPGAWMSLNSPGWPRTEIGSRRLGLTRLIEASGNELLRLQAATWLVRDHEGDLAEATAPPPPTPEDLVGLPRWARVAFAVRCARRVEELFAEAWPTAPERHLESVRAAVDAAERAAARADADAVSDAHQIDAEAAVRAATRSKRADPAAPAAARAVHFVIKSAREPENAHAHASRAALNAAYAIGSAPTKLSDFTKIIAAMWNDLAVLRAAAKKRRWRAHTPVAPSICGPLG